MKPDEESQSYRERIATVDEAGKRVWVYPKKPKGPFYLARTILSFFLLAFLFGAPFISVNNHPLLLFNIIERRFIIFGVPFWPQDMYIFAILALALLVFIILFTVIYGRLFCGWICPQTVFMEMVFRKIEYFIEGDANKQRALNKQPWNFKKLIKKFTKHVVFYFISFVIGNTFLAYIIGKDELFLIISEPPSHHLEGFIAMVIFSFVFYGVFAWFREQACVVVCPYGRLQGVLLDRDSIAVSYDFKRGEPRGFDKPEIQKHSDKGDCVDCGLCVEVCPTGIDIRNGTQLECVNCTACIDACNNVMDKFKRARGLIRYASYNSIVGEIKKSKVNVRALAYTLILVLILGFSAYLLMTRPEVDFTILRTPGMTYQELPGELIQNVYSIKLINKTYQDQSVTLQINNYKNAELVMLNETVFKLKSAELLESVFFIRIPEHQIKKRSETLNIDVLLNGHVLKTISTRFNAPVEGD